MIMTAFGAKLTKGHYTERHSGSVFEKIIFLNFMENIMTQTQVKPSLYGNLHV